MLLWLAHLLQPYLHSFRVFQYLSFRSIVSALTALSIVLFFSPTLIRRLTLRQIGQTVRNDGPESHLKKAGTPTMGGVLIILAMTISMLLWGDLSNRYLWVVLLTTLGFGAIGWIDDYLKVIKKDSKGLSARKKFFWQSVIGMTAVCVLYFTAASPNVTELVIPFVKDVAPKLGVKDRVVSN